MKDNRKSTTKKKDKLTIISEMDELKVIANNHMLMKRYSEAIEAAERIINLALEVKMESIIREQEEFITGIYKIVETDKLASIILDDFEQIRLEYEELSKKNKFEEAHSSVQKFKEKYDEHYNLKLIDSLHQFFQEETKRWNHFKEEESSIRLLEPLEIQFNSYIHTNNIPLANDTLIKAKELLKKVKVDYIVNKWKNFESKYLELKGDYDLKGDFNKRIELVANLTEEYKFDEAHNLLSELIKLTDDKGFSEYKDKLAIKKRNVEDAEAKYNKLLNDIAELEIEIQKNIEKDRYEAANINCDQVIKIARFIGKQELLDKYEKEKEALNERIKQHQHYISFKENIIEVSKIAINKLNQEYFLEALEKYKEILHNIQEYLEE
jgi:hypothetical protein